MVLIAPDPDRCLLFDPRHEKTNVLVSDLVRHKPGFTTAKDG